MNYSVNLSSGQTVEVVIGEAAQINVEQALNYIESGRVEITKYVNEWAKPEITNYTNEYAKPIVTEIVNQTTKPLIDDYLNTTTKPQIDEYVADNVKPYADSAQDSAAKAKISEDNAKTSETNAKASELAAASSAGVASAAAVTATEAKDYTAKVLTDKNLNAVGQDLQSADSNIKTVSTNIVNVNTVAKNIDNVNLLAPHTEAMEALAPDIMDVVTVAGITEQTKNVSDNMAHVVAVDNNKANIDNVAANATNITTVATSMNNVNAVAANKANIDNVAANKTNINTVSANIAAVNNVSENMADVKNAVQSANDAKLWAVGTKTEKPEGSSKYWAEEAKNAAQVYDATETVKGIVRLATSEEVTAGTNDSAAITPLKLKSKLETKQDKSTAINYNNISNCITEIPQDIKLELNNGTLTLKAGSKVYVPNGFESDGTTKKFDVVITDRDVSIPKWDNNVPGLISITSNREIWIALLEQQFSGSSAPTTQWALWYDTSNNKIKSSSNAGSTWKEGYCFPIAICTANSSEWTSIDQVFNGFGYIGSTVFALPGVKGLIPNGRNADGSLKSIEFTLDKVLTATRDWTVNNQANQHIRLGLNDLFFANGYVDSLVMPTVNNYILWYNPRDNIMRYNNTNNNVTSIADYPIVEWMELGATGVGDNTSRITNFTPKTVFHALDYNDKSTISGWSMPSSRYIDLTLGASGSTYTAPANGYFYLVKVAGKDNGDIRFTNETKNIVQEVLPKNSTNWIYIRMEAQKGDVFKIVYYATGDTKKFRFIFAEGESFNQYSSSTANDFMGPSGGF